MTFGQLIVGAVLGTLMVVASIAVMGVLLKRQRRDVAAAKR